MKYFIEVNTNTQKGAELLHYIKQLKAPTKAVKLLLEPPLTDIEMAHPPTRKISKDNLVQWLTPATHEQNYTANEAREYLKNKLAMTTIKKKAK